MERNDNCTLGTESSESEVGETTNSPNFTALLNKARENICGAKNLHNIVDSVAKDIKSNYRKSIVKRAVHPVLVCSTPFSTQKIKNEDSFSNFSTLSKCSDQPKNEELHDNKEKESDDCRHMGEDINIDVEKPDTSIKNQVTKSKTIDVDEFIEISDQERTLTENNVEEELKKNCSYKSESSASNDDISSNKEEEKKKNKDNSKIIIVKQRGIDRKSRKNTRSPSVVKKSFVKYDYVTEDSEEDSETVLERRKRRQKSSTAISNHKNRIVKVHKGRSLSRKSKKYVIITESSEDDRKRRRKHSVKKRDKRVIRVPISDLEDKRTRKHRGTSRSSHYRCRLVETDTSISSEHSESDSSAYYESKKYYPKHKSEKKAKIRDKSRFQRTQFSEKVRREYSRGRRDTKFHAIDDNHCRDSSKRLSRKDTFNLQSKTKKKKEKFPDNGDDISSSTIESRKTMKVVDLLSEIRNLLTYKNKDDSKGKNIVPEITNVANLDTINNMKIKEMDVPVEVKKADMSSNENLKKTNNSDNADVISKMDININENVTKTRRDIVNRTHTNTNANIKKTKRDNVDIINKRHIKTHVNLNKSKRDNSGVINETLVNNDEVNQDERGPPVTPLLLKLNKIMDEDLQFYRVSMDLLREQSTNKKNKFLRKVAKQPNSILYCEKAKSLLCHNNKRGKKKKYVCKKKLHDILASLWKKSAKKNRRTNTIAVQTSLIKTLEDSQLNVQKAQPKNSPKLAKPNTVNVEHKKNYLEELRAVYISDSSKVSDDVSADAQSCVQNVIILQNLTVQKKQTEDEVGSSEDSEEVGSSEDSGEVEEKTGELSTKNKPVNLIHWAPMLRNIDDSSSENFIEDFELTQSVTSSDSTNTPAVVMVEKEPMQPVHTGEEVKNYKNKVPSDKDSSSHAPEHNKFPKGSSERSPQDKLGNKDNVCGQLRTKGGNLKDNQMSPPKKDVINSPSSQNSPIDRKKVAKTTRKISPRGEAKNVVRKIPQETTDKNEFLSKVDLSPHFEKPREVPKKGKDKLRCKLNFTDTESEPLDMDSGIKSDDVLSPRRRTIEERKQMPAARKTAAENLVQEITQGRDVGTDKKGLVASHHFVKPKNIPVKGKKKIPCTKLEFQDQDSDTELLHMDTGIKKDAMEERKRISPRRKPAEMNRVENRGVLTETRASVSPKNSREPKSFGSKHKCDIREENVQEMNMDSGFSNDSSVPSSNKKGHNLHKITIQTSEIQEKNTESAPADVSEQHFAKPIGVPKKSKKKLKSPASKKDAGVEKQEKKKATKIQSSARTKKNKQTTEKNDSELVIRRSNREKKAVDHDWLSHIIQYSEKEVRKFTRSAATSMVSEQSENTSKSRSNKKTTSAAAKNVEKKVPASRKTKASRQAENALIKSPTVEKEGTTTTIPDGVEASGNMKIPVAPNSSEHVSTDEISPPHSDTGTIDETDSNRSDTQSVEKKKSSPGKRPYSRSKPPTKKTKKKTETIKVSARKKSTKNGIQHGIETSQHEEIENDEDTTWVETNPTSESPRKTSNSTEKQSNASETATEAAESSTIGESTSAAEIPDMSAEEEKGSASEKTTTKRKKAVSESETNKRRRKHGTMEMPSFELPTDSSSTIDIDIEAHRQVWQTIAGDVDRIGKGVSGTYKLTSANGFLALAPKNTQSFVNNENEQIYFRLEGTYSLKLGNGLMRNLPVFIIPKGVPAELRNTGKKRVLFMYAMR